MGEREARRVGVGGAAGVSLSDPPLEAMEREEGERAPASERRPIEWMDTAEERDPGVLHLTHRRAA